MQLKNDLNQIDEWEQSFCELSHSFNIVIQKNIKKEEELEIGIFIIIFIFLVVFFMAYKYKKKKLNQFNAFE